MPANGKTVCPRCGQEAKVQLSGTENYHIDCSCDQLEVPRDLDSAAEFLQLEAAKVKSIAEAILVIDYL